MALIYPLDLGMRIDQDRGIDSSKFHFQYQAAQPRNNYNLFYETIVLFIIHLTAHSMVNFIIVVL